MKNIQKLLPGFIFLASLLVGTTAQAMKRNRQMNVIKNETSPFFYQVIEEGETQRKWRRQNLYVKRQELVVEAIVLSIKKSRPVAIQRNGKGFKCDECIFTVKNKTWFETHKKHHKAMHTNPLVKMHSCERCGYLNPNKKPFQEHLISHQNEKKYFCAVRGCTARFKSKRSLGRHNKTIKHSKY